MIIFEIAFKLFSQFIKLIIFCDTDIVCYLKIVSSQSYNVRWIIIIWHKKYSAENNIEFFIWIWNDIHFVWITRYINEIFNELN